MPLRSPYRDLDIPETSLLDYLYPKSQTPSRKPVWIDADEPSTNLSPKQSLLWIRRLGFGLQKLGIRPSSDVCMIFTPNHIFVPVAYLGIVSAGAAFSGANPAYTVLEMVHQIKTTGTQLILVHPTVLETALEAASRAGLSKDRLFLFSDQELEPIQGVQDWRRMIGTEDEAEEWRWAKLSPEESRNTVATINYSSGTTGLPKGVAVSHHNLIANVKQTIFSRFLGKERRPERWLGFLPLYHAFGQLYVVLMATKLGTPTYVMKSFQFERFLQHIQKYKITTLQTAPPILVMLNKRPETRNYNLSSLESILCGAAPLSRELQNEVAARFKVDIIQGWGMTEVVCGGLMNPGGSKDHTGSVGMLLPNMEAKLIDDDGNESHERGELLVRGPNVFLRYWKNDSATKESIDSEGWFTTGDVVIVNKEGKFWIIDRKKELIKVNALQVAPAELEAALLDNPEIEDAAVTAILLDGNEVPRAYIVLKNEAKGKVSESQIQEWMNRRVARHKYLAGGIKFVNEVPRLASGKIQRKTLREWAKKDAEALRGGTEAMAKL